MFVEKDTGLANQLAGNIRDLQAQNYELFNADALQWLQHCKQVFDIVFLDPPFHQGLTEQACDLLRDNRCIHKDSLLYIESELQQPVPRDVTVRKEQRAGKVKFMLVEMV